MKELAVACKAPSRKRTCDYNNNFIKEVADVGHGLVNLEAQEEAGANARCVMLLALRAAESSAVQDPEQPDLECPSIH